MKFNTIFKISPKCNDAFPAQTLVLYEFDYLIQAKCKSRFIPAEIFLLCHWKNGMLKGFNQNDSLGKMISSYFDSVSCDLSV